jgi:CheY-like chemotaxis protein
MKKILLVEDDGFIIDFVTSAFNRRPEYGLLKASTCDDALKIAKTNPDLSLVWMDGSIMGNRNRLDTEDLVRQIKTICPNVVIVATSSRADWNQLLVAAGCDCTIAKPEVFSQSGLRQSLALIDQVPA